MFRNAAFPRFLICRLSAVGDTIHTLPLAAAIRQQWPNAFIAWVVEKGAFPFVQHSPLIDAPILAPKGFLKSPRALWNLRSQLQSLHIDVTFDPQSLTKSAVCAWLSGAKTRIGFAKPHGRELAPWLNNRLIRAQQTHVVPRYLELLTACQVNLETVPISFPLPIHATSRQSMQAFLQGSGIPAQYAIINPGAGWDSKIWPTERYAKVAEHLSLPSVVVWAGERERTWAEEIVTGSGGKAVLAPATSLLELMELVRGATLFIGSDTGPLHIAAAVNTPCIGVYGPTDAAICGPYGSGHTVLQVSVDGLGSNRKTRGVQSDSMLQVQWQQVVTSCNATLLQKSLSDQAA
jgi:heptosyltransferase I